VSDQDIVEVFDTGSSNHEIVEVYETVAAVMAASVVVPADLTVTIKKVTTQLEEMRQSEKTRAESIAQEKEHILNLQNLLSGGTWGNKNIIDDELPSYGTNGEVLPRGRVHELRRRQKYLQGLEEASAACTRNIETKERELARLRQAAAAPVVDDVVRTLCALARQALGVAEHVQRTGEEHGKALREWHELEQTMGKVANTERAKRALSLAALRERLAYATVPSGTFEIDPNAAGVRGQQVFIKLADIDPRSPWRGLTLFEICDQHYAQVIAEACRGR
jgi:hypothetical protein